MNDAEATSSGSRAHIHPTYTPRMQHTCGVGHRRPVLDTRPMRKRQAVARLGRMMRRTGAATAWDCQRRGWNARQHLDCGAGRTRVMEGRDNGRRVHVRAGEVGDGWRADHLQLRHTCIHVSRRPFSCSCWWWRCRYDWNKHVGQRETACCGSQRRNR